MNKILIIEDDLEINALLADFLKEKGYAVHCQYDGLHVLDFLNKEKIDLIILDIMLPYRSGDIILSDVRKKFTIPVIWCAGGSARRAGVSSPRRRPRTRSRRRWRPHG